MIQHTKLLSAPAGDMPRLQLDDTDDVREHFVIVTNFAGGPNEIYVATDASKVLFEFGIQAARWIPVAVEGIVRNRVPEQGYVDWTGGEFLAHGQRSFAVEVAAALCAGIDNRIGIVQRVEDALIGRSYTSAAQTGGRCIARKLTVI